MPTWSGVSQRTCLIWQAEVSRGLARMETTVASPGNPRKPALPRLGSSQATSLHALCAHLPCAPRTYTLCPRLQAMSLHALKAEMQALRDEAEKVKGERDELKV